MLPEGSTKLHITLTDMGLGKTFVGAEKMHRLDEPMNLVICQKSKIDDWVEHFNYWYDDMSAYDLTKPNAIDDFMAMPIGMDPVVGVINYELAFRRPELTRLVGFTLMLDESSMIQNENAKRSKFILSLNPKNVILLSGTPTAGKYENLWSQLHLLGWNISKELYWKQYVKTEWIEEASGFRIPHVIGYKNVDRLKMKLADHGAVFMKTEDAWKLPQTRAVTVDVKATKEYREFMKNSIVTVKDPTGKEIELIGDTTLTKRLYARQLCGHLNPHKLEAFEDLITGTSDRLIVFYNFNAELEELTKIAVKKTPHISVMNGSMKDMTAYEEMDDSITFIQYQAGAMGLNLQKANKIIYFTLPERSELFEQSKKRIHRIGQDHSCFYYYLLCKNTVEMDVLDTLEMRKDYSDNLFKGYAKKEGGTK